MAVGLADLGGGARFGAVRAVVAKNAVMMRPVGKCMLFVNGDQIGLSTDGLLERKLGFQMEKVLV